MGMKLAFRWFGEQDAVTLRQIRQIPGVSTIVSACYETSAGERWQEKDVRAICTAAAQNGLSFEVAEGLPVHEEIKLGGPRKDAYIQAYIDTLGLLASMGVRVVCYNFMPLFGWIRTDLKKRLPDGSTTVAFYEDSLQKIDPAKGELRLPGWNFSTQREEVRRLLREYEALGTAGMWRNLIYFLEAVVPQARRVGIRLAIHPDDPPLPVFGLPRIVSTLEDLIRLTSIVNDSANGITLCTGSLGSGREKSVEEIALRFSREGKLPFVHARNISFENKTDFVETAHPTSEGNLNMAAILRALHKGGFDGYLRPDHGRMIWGETGKPGYGLFDRALGCAYFNGLWEAISAR